MKKYSRWKGIIDTLRVKNNKEGVSTIDTVCLADREEEKYPHIEVSFNLYDFTQKVFAKKR